MRRQVRLLSATEEPSSSASSRAERRESPAPLLSILHTTATGAGGVPIGVESADGGTRGARRMHLPSLTEGTRGDATPRDLPCSAASHRRGGGAEAVGADGVGGDGQGEHDAH